MGGTLFGAGANLLGQGVPFLLLLLVTPVLLRTLGRETYGALILFNLIPQIAGQLDLGIVTAGTRAYAQLAAHRRMAEARRIIGEALLILGTWGVLLAIGFVAWRHAIADGLKLDAAIHGQDGIFAVAAIGIPSALINGVALIPLRAVEQYGRAARIQIVAGVVYWTACAFAATAGASLLQLVTLGTVTVALTTIALFLSARGVRDATRAGEAEAEALPGIPVPRPDGSVLTLRPYLSFGAGAFVVQASALATYHADKLLVSALISPAAAGAYAVCTNIANKILLVVAAGATFTFPRSTKLHAEGDHVAIARTFVVATRFVMMIAAATAVPLVALASPFLRTWIGAEFADRYATTMQLLVVGYAINASSVVASNIAIGIGDVRIPAVFAVCGGITTLLAVVLLTPRYGASGAAFAGLLGMSQTLLFNATIASRLGADARKAAWPLVFELVSIAVPVALLASACGAWVDGWITLIAAALCTSALFCAAWLSTFGRRHERVVITALVLRLFGKTSAETN